VDVIVLSAGRFGFKEFLAVLKPYFCWTTPLFFTELSGVLVLLVEGALLVIGLGIPGLFLDLIPLPCLFELSGVLSLFLPGG
tara:strand:- start:421 stop:666 length:246 start_codon:yes stop_codon:yes gene_type:complete